MINKVQRNLSGATVRCCKGNKLIQCIIIAGHVHDEVIIEANPETTIEAICEEMQKSPPWLSGIELRADGYECGYYMKL